MKKAFCILLFANILSTISIAQSFTDKDSLFALSKKENKCILMVFSGSDWCANCIRLEKNILQDTIFRNFIQSNLLYLNIDFPQRKKQSDLLKKQNEELAELYNPNGTFPAILLLSPGKKSMPVIYQQEPTTLFIEKIKKAVAYLNENNAAQN